MLLNGYQSGICNPHILEKCNCSLSSGAKNRDRNLNQFPPMSSQQEQRPFLGELSSMMTRCDSTVQKFPLCAEPCWLISASEPTSRFASALLHQPPPNLYLERVNEGICVKPGNLYVCYVFKPGAALAMGHLAVLIYPRKSGERINSVLITR